MSVKAVNFKLEENKIMDMKNVANTFHITMTDVVNAALDKYLAEVKQDPFYRLTNNIEDASAEESAEILNALESLSDDDLEISSVTRIKL